MALDVREAIGGELLDGGMQWVHALKVTAKRASTEADARGGMQRVRQDRGRELPNAYRRNSYLSGPVPA